ncbi:hypothetical protein BJ322DRAFT_1088140 [Thelephora terrestris]|uniref:Chromatin target of PRMT1 protein C-terminal domain-containing protein n=1 Tax=Thelephora terrestris TaxID=56493 RepID=A0A9P6H4V9_9AGAM|nr:hypothetical protein BJ322DRAFT_1088140 [Thelephora terrestris]
MDIVAESIYESAPVSSEAFELPYDDSDDIVGSLPPEPSLASRIGKTKVYLYSESDAASMLGKRKHEPEGEEAEEETEGNGNVVDDDTDESLRPNAILLQGMPISNLPTSNIFAYVGHYDVKPIGLEWVDDTTCVLVFETRRAAVASFDRLLMSGEEQPDVFGLNAAQPVPPGVSPQKPKSGDDEAVVSESDLFGGIRMRPARKDDVKQRGAKSQSRFYQRHGEMAGKDGRGFFDDPPSKRKRRGADEEIRARLDQDLENFAAGEDAPLSKMRSDNMEELRGSPVVIELPGSEGRRRPPHERRGSGRRRGRRGEGGNARPRKSQQELDDELDAFLLEGKDR